MLENLKPIQTNSSYWSFDFSKKEIDGFLDAINIETGDIKGKTIYLDVKSISQSKLRDADFKITRSKDKADVIVIRDIRSDIHHEYKDKCTFYASENPTHWFDIMIAEEDKNYKYITDKEIYKYIYKYTGDFELFKSCDELFSGNNRDNTKIAMEFMCNANWEGNEIYLRELFNLYWWNNIRGSQYKSSISFRGFLTSLDFDYESDYNLSSASDYRKLCKNEEHHNFVYNKYSKEFEDQFKELCKRHKIKIDELKFSIDKEILYDEEED